MFRGLLPLLAIVAFTYIRIAIPMVPMLDGRIVGGENAKIENFPYQVSLRFFGYHVCGGSILNARVVLTAAHCLSFLGAKFYSVEYGSAENEGGTIVGVQYVEQHEEYSGATLDYDVGLVFLAEDIVFGSNAQPIALATVVPAAGTPVVVTGWGVLVDGGEAPTVLQKVEVEIKSQEVCSDQYESVNEITDRMVCAGVNGGGKDACSGDSGGPLVANNELVGIVSWGSRFCDHPTVFANVAILRSWIDPQISKQNR